MDYAIHFLLESVGGGIGVYAYRFCNHTIHRVGIWFVFTALTSVATVQAVG